MSKRLKIIAGCVACFVWMSLTFAVIAYKGNAASDSPENGKKTFRKGILVMSANIEKPPPSGGDGGRKRNSIPPTPGGGGGFSPVAREAFYEEIVSVEELREDLLVSTLNETRIVFTPRGLGATIKSLNLEIYSGKDLVHTTQIINAENEQTFKAVENQRTRVTGYPITFNQNTIAEAEQYFVPGNTVRLSAHVIVQPGASAAFYIVNPNSEIR
jgi:hypothetical protein